MGDKVKIKTVCAFLSYDNYYIIEGIAVDWINSKLYWTDVQTRWIGVMDLTTRYYGMLLSTQADVNPREIVVDPTTRYTCLQFRNYSQYTKF